MTMLRDTLTGARSLLTGMKVTLKHCFRPPVTSQYPREKLEMSKAYRNVIVLVEVEGLGSHDCIDCNACVRVCPSDCIAVEGERPEGLKRKRATLFEVDFALCSECGLCIDVCPTDTLGYSREFDQAGYQRGDFLYDLIEPWRAGEEACRDRLRQAEAETAAARAVAKKAAAEKKAAEKKAATAEVTPAEAKTATVEKPEKSEKPQESTKAELPVDPEKPEKPAKPVKPERPDEPARAKKPVGPDKREEPLKVEKPVDPDRSGDKVSDEGESDA